MQTKSKKISDSRVEITVILDAKDLAPARKTALEKLAKESDWGQVEVVKDLAGIDRVVILWKQK